MNTGTRLTDEEVEQADDLDLPAPTKGQMERRIKTLLKEKAA